MNKNMFSPFIRLAMYSTIAAPFEINERIIFDYEMIFVSGGRCKLTIDGKEYFCKKNDVVFLRPGIPHKFESVDSADFIQPHFHFDVCYDEKSEDRFVSFKTREKMDAYEKSLICYDVFEFTDIPFVFVPYNIEKFRNIFFDIIEIYLKKPYNYELLYKQKALELLDEILRQFDKGTTNKNVSENDALISVKNYIDNNFLSVITLDSLSGQFYFNKYTLLRKFKSVYKQNIMTYYKGLRLNYAKNILKTTSISIHSLAEKLNFSDIYSFSRFFKSSVGCSPTVYRKNDEKKSWDF
ncbi:MAG: helix-turn-helix transcriptional regulator [Clostridia bacterium]|nr:helix-turn-helix transcriptional regulator [Clostridia bacterium]